MTKKILLSTLMSATLLLGGCGGTEDVTVSEEQAKQIALEDAGLTMDQVTFIQSVIETDDGQKSYDIEFYTADGVEYDYAIDPYTGEILEYDFEVETIYD